MSISKEIPIVYNLFPRLAGTMPEWLSLARRAWEMNFNWLYINSILYPGFSGSLYSVKDYYRINPDFLPAPVTGDGISYLAGTLRQFQEMGLDPMMDLVINHTAIDSPLTQKHPEWYVRDEKGRVKHPFSRDPDNLNKVTVWGDLAEIDNRNSPDQGGLWRYWAEVVKFYLELGFKGFRCDAAYKVPAELWRYLMSEAKKIDRGAVFFAETLGAAHDEALALGSAGLNYFFNSSRWWDFRAPWALEQHEEFGRLAPSISFPESHDTPRLAFECGGNEMIQRQRYAFAACFSAGVMMPIGYEFGFKKKLDVVKTRPSDWEEPAFDLKPFIRRVNELKLREPLLHGEGKIKSFQQGGGVILKRETPQAPGRAGYIIINRCCDIAVSIDLRGIVTGGAPLRLYRFFNEETLPNGVPFSERILPLAPLEIVLLLDSGKVSG